MNYMIVKGLLNGMWPNGLTGTKRSMNLLIKDEAAVYKTSLWQEESDWAAENLTVGDEVYLRGQVSGLWKNEEKAATGIEISSPEILSFTRQNDVKSDLIAHITDKKNQKCGVTD